MQEMQETEVQSPSQEDPLEEGKDRGARQAVVHRDAKNQT